MPCSRVRCLSPVTHLLLDGESLGSLLQHRFRCSHLDECLVTVTREVKREGQADASHARVHGAAAREDLGRLLGAFGLAATEYLQQRRACALWSDALGRMHQHKVVLQRARLRVAV